MTNFKPSELPVGTEINDEVEGYHTKEIDGAGNTYWAPAITHCVDCEGDYHVPNEKANEVFKDFGITAVPWAVAWELALKLQDEYGTVDSEGEDITLEGLIKDAMDETLDIQQEEWEKAQRDS